MVILRDHAPSAHRPLDHVYSAIAEQLLHFWHMPTCRVRRVLVQEMLSHLQLALVRLDTYAHVLPAFFLHLIYLGLSFAEAKQCAE